MRVYCARNAARGVLFLKGKGCGDGDPGDPGDPGDRDHGWVQIVYI